jgi:hypothetical protein
LEKLVKQWQIVKKDVQIAETHRDRDVKIAITNKEMKYLLPPLGMKVLVKPAKEIHVKEQGKYRHKRRK